MYARLWWKELRQIWPIWIVLILTAVVSQSALLSYDEREFGAGFFFALAIGLTGLYAVVAGAAAFAGERELGTLDLLDALPVPRGVLWGSKATFALASMGILLMVLLAIAATGTRLAIQTEARGAAMAFGAVTILLEAMGWSFFWSARMRSALSAALLAIVSLAVSILILSSLFAVDVQAATAFSKHVYVRSGIIRILLAVGLFAASAWKTIAAGQATTLEHEPERGFATRLRIRSPLVVERDDEASDRTKPPVRRRQPLWPEIRSLLWQTLREGTLRWLFLVALGSCFPVLMLVLVGGTQIEAAAGVLLLLSLAAGISVFHPETRDETRRFLAQHGAGVRRIWVVRVLVWGLGLGLSVLLLVWLQALVGVWRSSPATNQVMPVLMALIYPSFTVGILAGMAFRRGITAIVMAVLLLAALAVPVGTLASVNMMPTSILILLPLPWLVVSWLWKGDWMFDRPNLGRWVRLGAFTVLALGTLAVTYTALRAYDVPLAQAAPPPGNWGSDVPDAENAAAPYRRLGSSIISESLWDELNQLTSLPSEAPERQRFLERNRDLVEGLRAASALPRCRFERPRQATLFSHPVDASAMRGLGMLLELDADRLISRGDLDGAWRDILATFRMSRHLGEDAGVSIMLQADAIERRAVDLAFRWAARPDQTSRRLIDALTALDGLPHRKGPEQVVLTEAAVVEQTLDLPDDAFRVGMAGWSAANRKNRPLTALADTLSALPWERTRARRTFRLVFLDALDQARRDPWGRERYDPITRRIVYGAARPPRDRYELESPLDKVGGSGYLPRPWQPELLAYCSTTPFVSAFMPPTESYLAQNAILETRNRLLQVTLRLRAWQLSHDGHLPDSLDALTADGRGELPVDPFNGHEFGYHRDRRPNAGNQMVLYSVGPDVVDNLALIVYPDRMGRGDLIVPLPLAPEAADRRPEADGAPRERGAGEAS